MNRDETRQALEELRSSAAAAWIGNKLSDDGTTLKLIQKCMRCGAEEEMELPPAAAGAFRFGARGEALAGLAPENFDEKLFTWKKTFQRTHEGCGGDAAA